MTFQFQLAVVGIVFALGIGTGWKINGWRYESERRVAERAMYDAMDATARELAKLDIKYVTINQEVQKHVIEKPIYRDCVHDPDTFRLLNTALQGGSVDSSKLPRTNPDDKSNIRRNNP